MTDTEKPALMARSRKLILPAIAAAIGLAILLNLGIWQLDRLAWKEALIEKVEADLSSDPVAPPSQSEWTSITPGDDYRRVRVSGRFEDGAAFYYTALTRPVGEASGPGYMVYSPFVADTGETILVNRGFLPQDLPEAARASALRPAEENQTISGILRLSEKPNWTTPAVDETTRIWFARDTEHIGKVLGVAGPKLAPFSIDLDKEFTPAGGFPQAGETVVRFKNDHLGYALTWFGLAATLLGVFLAYAATILWPRKET